MPTEDRSGTWYANRQRARAIYSQHLIEQQALNQGTANRMNSNGASSGTSTVFYAVGTTSGSGEELAAVLLANSAVPPTPPAPPAAPTAPADVTVAYAPPAAGGIEVSWTASSSYVTPTYTIVASPGDITKTLIPGTIPETSIKFNEALDGIILGTTYTFVVTAENDIGTSPPSAPSAPIKAITYADPPSGVSAIGGQNGQTTVSWIASIYDGESPITAYTAYSYSSSDPVVHSTGVPGSDTSALITGLTNGFTYTFYVTSTNAFGEGAESIPSSAITPLGPPTKPLNVSATAGLGNAVVTWEAPLNDGGVPIGSYTITSSPPDFSDILTMPFSPLSVIANGLTNGTSYTFTVFATNTKGDSPLSDPSAAVMPVGAPDPPTNVVATPGNAEAFVTWDEPQSYGGSALISYRAVSIPGNITITTSPSQRSATFSGLINGTSYEFVVFATNAIGESLPSGGSYPVTPSTVPNAPLNAFAIAGNGEAQVLWDFPVFDGGSAIINFTVISVPATASGPQTTPDDSTTLIFLGLTNGTPYAFTVFATNVSGNSPASALTNPVTPLGFTVPGPPQTVSASLDAPGKILVSWSAPVSDGGSSILSYKIYADPPDVAPQSVSSAFTTVDFDNTLTNGTLYTFTVTATNAIGESLPSAGATATPAIAPSVPENFTVTPRNQGAILTWSSPLSTGGPPISFYTGYFFSASVTYTDWVVAGNVFTYVVPDTLTNGTLYSFRVAAVGPGGLPLYISSYAAADATPGLTVADPPNIISVVAGPGTGEVTITITPNIYDGGGVFQNYLVQDVGATFAATPSSSPAVLAGLLSAATYQFTVKTVTSIGTSAASAPSSSVTVP